MIPKTPKMNQVGILNNYFLHSDTCLPFLDAVLI